MNKRIGPWVGVVLGCVLGAACADDDGQGVGSVKLTISGEEASRSGFPVGSGEDAISFVDGWEVTFHKVLVALQGFTLATAAGDTADLDLEPVVADLHLGEPALWKLSDVPAKRWDRVSYRVAAPTDAARAVNDIAAADLARMRDAGYAVYIEATASKDDREIALQWGFPSTVEHSRCENASDGTEGLVVRDNAETAAQITIHLDHLFFDSWTTEEPNLRFDAMAAVAPGDGPLTLDDLAQQDNLSDLMGEDGKPLELAYDPGSTFDPVPSDLAQYVIDAATTAGHWNGEGHCEYEKQ
ncbi:MAG: hypothetical protein ABW321_18135 [Polyangiales bacterium]